jgi:hypothetical protein
MYAIQISEDVYSNVQLFFEKTKNQVPKKNTSYFLHHHKKGLVSPNVISSGSPTYLFFSSRGSGGAL